MGGGGGDGGYQERAAAQDQAKQRGREAVNALFGVAPTSAAGPAPDRARFTTAGPSTATPEPLGGWENAAPASGVYMPEAFDSAGYNSAMDEYGRVSGLSSQAAAAKSGRDALYDKVRGDFFGAGRRQIDEQKAEAQRKLKFALFDAGLNGSSIATDKMADVRRRADQGILDLGAKADAARAELQGSDESTRLGLLQSLDAGMDAGSATSSALNQMKVASDKAASGAQGAAIGDLFGDLAMQNDRYQGKKEAQKTYDSWRAGSTSAGLPLYSRS